MLEEQGRLFGIQVGNRVYYRLDQLLEVLGEPQNPEVLRISKNYQTRVA